ncbi:SemiSWEET transporter [Priestia megaterium]|uniref:SemiSWEET transporter n=1 Tax=Priestia megaterium TaxID=1404 RepID=A0A6H1NZG7_PRIMG|nr:SemiSWEET transporter [Priestia megaterium]QIZ06686.1 SemiSWEET transporter [Priestia megaterium]
MQELVPLFGYVAAILTTLSFLPQAIKTIKEKNTEGISLVMYSLFTSGVLMWLLYGLFVNDIPIIVANAVTLILAVTILTLKIKYSQMLNNRKKTIQSRTVFIHVCYSKYKSVYRFQQLNSPFHGHL